MRFHLQPYFMSFCGFDVCWLDRRRWWSDEKMVREIGRDIWHDRSILNFIFYLMIGEVQQPWERRWKKQKRWRSEKKEKRERSEKKKRNEIIINQERDQFYHVWYAIIILWKEEHQPTNKQMKEKREIKITQNKESIWKPNKKDTKPTHTINYSKRHMN